MIPHPEKLLEMAIPAVDVAWTSSDTILYALATGFGRDPIDERELAFVIEGSGQRVSPTNAIALYYDDRWMDLSGVNRAMSLHGEQRNVFHQPIPPAGRGRVTSRFTGIFDKGPGRGLVVECEQVLHDLASGEPIATNVVTNFARADGGIGYSSGPAPRPHAIPARSPDLVIERTTRPEQALIYRLCGDRNPLHAVPETARAAGFPRPVLHGMCGYGFACRAVLQGVCDYDPARLRSFGARISAPVYPGDDLRTEIWIDGANVSFRVTVPERDGTIVFNNGSAVIA